MYNDYRITYISITISYVAREPEVLEGPPRTTGTASLMPHLTVYTESAFRVLATWLLGLGVKFEIVRNTKSNCKLVIKFKRRETRAETVQKPERETIAF